jgi:hypothetical protein
MTNPTCRSFTMKRLLAAAATGLLFSLSAAAMAQAADVSVTVGPELQKNTPAYGERDVAQLTDDLRKSVDRAIARHPGTAPQRVDLVLESATPNRPTSNQLGRNGLSMRSLGLGGAVITGTVTGADGVIKPISFRWQEQFLRNVIGYTTWTDADRAFQMVASDIARGRAPNQGPYRPDLASRAAFTDTATRLYR